MYLTFVTFSHLSCRNEKKINSLVLGQLSEGLTDGATSWGVAPRNRRRENPLEPLKNYVKNGINPWMIRNATKGAEKVAADAGAGRQIEILQCYRNGGYSNLCVCMIGIHKTDYNTLLICIRCDTAFSVSVRRSHRYGPSCPKIQCSIKLVCCAYA